MKDHLKTSSLWNEINESVQESNFPMMKFFEYEGQGPSNVVVQNVDKLGVPHVSGQYLERYIKENKKTTGQCTKYNTTVNEKFIKKPTELGHFFRFIVRYHGNEDYLILSNCSRN